MSDDFKKDILMRDKRIIKHIEAHQKLLFNIDITEIIEIELERIQSLHTDIHFLERSLLELVISNTNTREKIEIEEELLQLERQIFEEGYSRYFIILDESNE